MKDKNQWPCHSGGGVGAVPCAKRVWRWRTCSALAVNPEWLLSNCFFVFSLPPSTFTWRRHEVIQENKELRAQPRHAHVLHTILTDWKDKIELKHVNTNVLRSPITFITSSENVTWRVELKSESLEVMELYEQRTLLLLAREGLNCSRGLQNKSYFKKTFKKN